MDLHPATLWEAISDAVPDRLALVQGPTRRTWADLDRRAARLAGALAAEGLGAGSRVGILLHNCPEYLEAYVAALKLRAVPFNVNHRYTAEEVAYLLGNADADALVHHASLSSVAAGAAARAGRPGVLVEVEDGGPHHDGSARYEEVLLGADPAPRIRRDPDDVTMSYTGGTTGMPKGVVSRVGPPLTYLLQAVPPLMGRGPVALDDAPAFAASLEGTPDLMVSLPAPPLMHSTGMGIGALPALATGGTVVLLEHRHLDAHHLWDTVEAEGVNAITVVGDPFARPMLAALDEHPGRDLHRVRTISSSGAMFSAEVKAGLHRHLPQVVILDLIASTEGTMGMSIATADHPADTARFRPAPGVVVLGEDGHPLPPGSDEVGLVALPGGADRYHKDEARTASTFRVIDGTRYTVPGDLATIDADGTLALRGRGSSCINTAGEKVYPEEVEEALKSVGGVADALVFGVDDERFGQAVAAVISAPPGATVDVDAVLAAARQHLAGYKLPRTVVVVDRVPRTDVGKPDYPTARELHAAAGRSA